MGARKIKPSAQQIRKLLDAKKPREALAFAATTLDSFPGALALAAIRKLRVEARDAGFVVVGEFDDEDRIHFTWGTGSSKVELIDDPWGGKACRWVTEDETPGRALRWLKEARSPRASLRRDLGQGLDLAGFEYISMRLRTPKGPTGEVTFAFTNWDGASDYASAPAPLKLTTDWQEVVIQTAALQPSGKFDPKRTTTFRITCGGALQAEILIDDVTIARKR